jgi:hypothetical protein
LKLLTVMFKAHSRLKVSRGFNECKALSKVKIPAVVEEIGPFH